MTRNGTKRREFLQMALATIATTGFMPWGEWAGIMGAGMRGKPRYAVGGGAIALAIASCALLCEGCGGGAEPAGESAATAPARMR